MNSGRYDTRDLDRYRTPDQQATLADDLRTIFYAFASRWFLIGVVVALCIGAGVVYLWTAKPTYVSTVRILVDPRERQLMEREIVPTGLGSSSLGADSALVESQVEILASRSVLDQLIETENLLEDPEFGLSAGNGGNAAKALVRSLLYGPNVDSFAPMSAYDAAIHKLERSIEVDRVGNTYVLAVSVKTGSAEKSARLANKIGAIYLAQSQQSADASTAEAAAALEGRLAGLRDTANAAMRDVEEYRSQNGLLGAQGVLIDERQLRNLNDQVTVANIEAERAKAKLDEIRHHSGLPASRLARSNILTSTLAENLRADLAKAISEEEVARRTYGSSHPSFNRAIQNRQALESELANEFSRILGRAESDYEGAVARVNSLREMLTELEGRQSDMNSASIRLRELELAAASSRAVYESFLQRSKEAREQIQLPSVTARIISEAVPGSRPSDPNLRVVLAASLFAGLVIGAAIAWMLHLFNGTQRRMPAAPRMFRLATRPSRTPRRAASKTAATPDRTQQSRPNDRGSLLSHVPG